MDSSKFHLWRACFSFCQVDNKLAVKEKQWLEQKAESLKFTSEQKEQLFKELQHPSELSEILPLITRPSDRAFLVDQMRVLAHIDGELSDIEKNKIQEIRKLVLARVNLTDLENKIALDEMASYHEDEVYKVNNKDSFFERLHRYAQKVVNPGDYKLPSKE
jgi:hypothetical protein